MTQETLTLTLLLIPTERLRETEHLCNASVILCLTKETTSKTTSHPSYIPALQGPRIIPPWREGTICKPCHAGRCCQGVVNNWSACVSNRNISKQKHIDHTMCIRRIHGCTTYKIIQLYTSITVSGYPMESLGIWLWAGFEDPTCKASAKALASLSTSLVKRHRSIGPSGWECWGGIQSIHLCQLDIPLDVDFI